jgi:hypothetical protein
MGDLFGSVPVAGPPVAASQTPAAFNDLLFVKPQFLIRKIETQVTSGYVSGLNILYSNGLAVSHGNIRSDLKGLHVLSLALHRGEKIIACRIETGKKHKGTQDEGDYELNSRVTGLQIFTNRGQCLVAQAAVASVDAKGTLTRDGVKYKEIADRDFDPAIQSGHLVAFWGYSTTPSSTKEPGFISCLGFIWGNHYNYTGPPIDSQVEPTNHPQVLTLKPGWSLTEINDSSSMKLANGTVISSVSRMPNTVEIFWIAADGSVQLAYFYEGQAWARAEIAPSNSAAQGCITATSCDPEKMELWWIGPSGSVEGCWWQQGRSWSRYQLKEAGTAALGASIVSISRRNLTQEVWWITPDGAVDGAAWYAGQSWFTYRLAAPGSAHPKGSMKVLSRDSKCMEIWYTSPDNSVKGCYWSETSNWQSYTLTQPGAVAEGAHITVVSRVPNAMELFWVAPDGGIVGKYWYDGPAGWQDAQYAPAGSAKATSALQAVAARPERMDVVFTAPDNSIQAIFWAESAWQKYPISDSDITDPDTPLAIASRRRNLVELWFKPAKGNMAVGFTTVN